MRDFILFSHCDCAARPSAAMWTDYLAALRRRGAFDGGSAIGEGRTFRQRAEPAPVSAQLSGYIRIRAASLVEAEALLSGHPVWESGGTVEIRELPRD